ncbi:MAG: hypothetical protein ACI4VC_04945 [Clostridia bacterium]
MEKTKKMILILLIIVVVVIIVIVAIIINNNNKEDKKYTLQKDVGLDAYEKEIDTKLQAVTNRTDFYVVKDCIGKYYSYYSIVFNAKDYYGTDDETVIGKAEEENSKVLYNMLDKEYTHYENITTSNIKSKLKKIENVSVEITEMYIVPKTKYVNVYVVKGNLKENTTNIDQFQVITKVDFANRTFSILPEEYVEEKYGVLTEGRDIDMNVSDSIEQNNNNTYQYPTVTDETYVKDLFSNFRNKLLYDATAAYNYLDEEYRDKKFGTIEQFNKYNEENKEKQKTMQLTKYQKTISDEYTEYVCIDQNNRYYIFRETAVMDYSVILDTYTIDLPQFIEKYNAASADEKAGMNIQKVIDAINDSDYHYAYSKLDETFKKSNFSSEDAFKKYAEQNFGNKQLEYESSKQEGDLYISDITIKENETSIAQKKIIMKLLDGTDFVMSFNIN